MPEELFALSEQYEEMLRRGIDLSGEGQEYFIRGRIRDLAEQLPAGYRPRRILDFGCGIGTGSGHLAEQFPHAAVVGLDISGEALTRAQRNYGSPRLSFGLVSSLRSLGQFDLCYVNGVFHHIEPEKRIATLIEIRGALARGGRLAVFENNPWNPGTRLVMRRIPFDRDAIPLPPPEARRLVLQAGFECPAKTRFLFYYPRMLSALRFTEAWLVNLPLGAQYYVLALKS